MNTCTQGPNKCLGVRPSHRSHQFMARASVGMLYGQKHPPLGHDSLDQCTLITMLQGYILQFHCWPPIFLGINSSPISDLEKVAALNQVCSLLDRGMIENRTAAYSRSEITEWTILSKGRRPPNTCSPFARGPTMWHCF